MKANLLGILDPQAGNKVPDSGWSMNEPPAGRASAGLNKYRCGACAPSPGSLTCLGAQSRENASLGRRVRGGCFEATEKSHGALTMRWEGSSYGRRDWDDYWRLGGLDNVEVL